ncbi:MAG: DinB family protein [Bacteroidetes bacterium]|jgi:uncharacterized damage-inducible protein DinB|nr:DinB family protein [Bacteroidota bacterium]
MDNHPDFELRNRLIKHIKGGQAFAPVGGLLQKISFGQLGTAPANLPYSFFQVFWHMRFAQLDILDYCKNDAYQLPNWPGDYWPAHREPKNSEEWTDLKKAFFNERDEFCNLISNTSNDLFEPLPQNPDHTLFRQAEILIMHTAYHTGQLHMLYRLLNRSSS